jgi:FixJ family two-component response regulator
MARRPLVSIVDDSESVLESLPDLLHFSGYDAEAFSSAESFLASPDIGGTNCLILDIALPGMSGPDLQRELKRFGYEIPIVFITAQDDQSLRPRLVADGAAAVLFKPFCDTALLDALSSAVKK